jgi:hypothetical protein
VSRARRSCRSASGGQPASISARGGFRIAPDRRVDHGPGPPACLLRQPGQREQDSQERRNALDQSGRALGAPTGPRSCLAGGFIDHDQALISRRELARSWYLFMSEVVKNQGDDQAGRGARRDRNYA